MESKYLYTVVFLFLIINLSSGERVGIDGIDAKLSRDGNSNNSVNSLTIDVGGRFYVHTTLKNPDKDGDNIRVYWRIYVGDTLVYDRGRDIDTDEGVDYEAIIPSDDFLSIWKKTFMAYDCRSSSDVKVEVYGDVPNDIDTAELSIESEKSFNEVRIVPPEPDRNDLIFIYAEDWVNETDYDGIETGGEPLEDAFISVTNLGENQRWDRGDDYDVFETDRYGMAKFTISKQREFRGNPYGRYRIIVLEKKSGSDYGDYCSHIHTFTIGRYINITIDPETPLEGEDMVVRIIDDENLGVAFVLLTVSGPHGMVLQTTTNELGVAHITINDSGIHSINALQEGCEECANSVSKWFEVTGKGALNLSIHPGEVDVGGAVLIEVSSGEGRNMKDAEVLITLPGGETINGAATNYLGVSNYIPKEHGIYKVTAMVEGYKKSTERFTAYNSFLTDVPEQFEINKGYVLTVKNHLGHVVSNATVLLEKLLLSKANLSAGGIYNESHNLTPILNNGGLFSGVYRTCPDVDGRFNLTVNETGFYRLNISGEGYRDLIKGLLSLKPLIVKLSSEEINLDKRITVSVYDSDGKPLDAVIEIRKPNGGVDRREDSSIEYKPMLSGDYGVEVSRRGYSGKAVEFKVLSYSINLSAEVEGNYLVIGVSSGGNPLVKTKIEVITPDSKRIEAYTGDDGVVRLDLPALNRKGNFTIRVRKRNYESMEVVKEITGWGGLDIFQLILMVLVFLVITAAAFFGYRYYVNRKIKKRLRKLRRGRKKRR